MSPENPSNDRNQIESLAEEFAARLRQGEHVTMDDYAIRFPELAAEIHELFPVVAMLDDAGKPPQLAAEKLETLQDESGKIVGEYRLLELLGRGGMGLVYRAKHNLLGHQVAIKMLPVVANIENAQQRFFREASSTARMYHPNILRVFDFGVSGESLYYAMELVNGWSLDKLIGNEPNSKTDSTSNATPGAYLSTLDRYEVLSERSHESQVSEKHSSPIDETKPLRAIETDRIATETAPKNLWEWIAGIGCQAADALDYAHSAGVVHRDVKPGNLMIDASDKVYVTDFGLAKIEDDTCLTRTGDVIGTLRYLAPESFSGNSDSRADLYGLGLTLYELIVNRPAFSGSERGEIVAKIQEGRVVPIRKLVPETPSDLQTIVEKAISVDPLDRYQSARELADDLLRFATGRPILARRSTWAYKTRRWVHRNQTITLLSTTILLSLIIGLIVSWTGWSRALTAEADAVRIARKEKQSRDLAVAESEAKNRAIADLQLALSEKQKALEQKEEQRKYAAAISKFVLNDLIPLTTVNGQFQWGATNGSSALNKNSTISDLLDRAAANLEHQDDLSPLVEAELCRVIGISFRHVGKHQEAVPLLERAVEILRDSNADEERLEKTQNSLAVAYSKAGQKDLAVHIYEEVLAKNEELPLVRLNYAELLGELGKSEQAMLIAEQVLTNVELEKDANAYTIARANYVLGDLLSRIGKIENAIPRYEEAIRLFRKFRSSDSDPKVMDALRALSESLSKIGRHDRAIRIMESVYETSKKTRRPTDPEFAFVMDGLGSSYRKAGQPKRAIPLHEAAIDILESAISPGHIETLAARSHLAFCYVKTGDLQNAKKEFAIVLQYLPQLNQNLDYQYSIPHNYATVLFDLGKYKEAIKYFNISIENSSRIHSPSHYQALSSSRMLSTCYSRQGDFDKAIEISRQVLGRAQAAYPKDHIQIIRSQTLLDDLLKAKLQFGSNQGKIRASIKK